MAMRPTRKTQDHVLIHRAIRREKEGATRLVAKYKGMVLSVLNRYTKDHEQAQDLAQETFFQAFRNLESLKDWGQFKAWLLKIAQRSFLAFKRSPTSQSQDMVLSSDAILPELPADQTEPDPLERRLVAHELRAVVDQLPDPYRLTLTQRFYQDLPLSVVAERQSINLPLAKYRVRHGIKLLRQALEDAGVTEKDV